VYKLINLFIDLEGERKLGIETSGFANRCKAHRGLGFLEKGLRLVLNGNCKFLEVI
jgi:hypothetical protein